MNIKEVARIATARYFGIGIDPSYLNLISEPSLQDVPAIRMINSILQAYEDVTQADFEAPTSILEQISEQAPGFMDASTEKN